MVIGPYHTPARAPLPNLSGLAPLASPVFSGQVQMPAGSAAAPSLAPAGDGNTGLFSPAGDTLALATNGKQRLTIDPSGHTVLNHSASLPGAFGATARLQVIQDANPSATLWRFNGTDVGGAYVFFERSRGSTVGQNALLQWGDGIGQLAFNGADGTTYHRAAILGVDVDGAAAVNSMPGRFVFYTTPNGSTNPIERMRVASDGTITLGQYPGAESLRVIPTSGAVNRIDVTGAVSGGAPSLAASGADANIDLTLTPKGSGRLRFGAYTAASGLTASGCIEVKDAGGTVRRLLAA